MRRGSTRPSRSAELEIGTRSAKSSVRIGSSVESPLLEWHIAVDAAATDRRHDRGDAGGSVERGDASTRTVTRIETRRAGAGLRAGGIRRPHVSSEGSDRATRDPRVVSESIYRRVNG